MRGPVREEVIPIPSRGIFRNADRGRVDPRYADVLEDWVTDGAGLRQNPGWAPVKEFDGLTDVRNVLGEFNATPDAPGAPSGGTRGWIVKAGTVEYGASGAVLPGAVGFNHYLETFSGHWIIAYGDGHPIRIPVGSVSVGDVAQTGLSGSGLDPANLLGVVAHRNRLYYWTGLQRRFWYGGVGAVTGALTQFDLAPLAGGIEGHVWMCATMHMGSGSSVDDVFVIITELGEVVVYSGSDPGDPSNWSLWGRFKIPRPLSRNCAARFGGDLLVLTSAGVISMASAMRDIRSARRDSLNWLISGRINVFEEDQTLMNAKLSVTPEQRFVIANIVSGGTRRQWAYDVEQGGWTLLRTPAARWIAFEGRKLGFVNPAGEVFVSALHEFAYGHDAAWGADGAAITSTWETPWLQLRRPRMCYLKPTVKATGPVTMTVTVLTDLNDTPRARAEAVQTVTLAPRNETALAVPQIVSGEEIAVGASGARHKVVVAVTGMDVEFMELVAGTM